MKKPLPRSKRILPRRSVITSLNNISFSASGRRWKNMQPKEVFRSSAISPFMSLWTAQMSGLIRIFLKSTKRPSLPWGYLEYPLIISVRPGNSGVILSIAGTAKILPRRMRSLTGGHSASKQFSTWLMLPGSIISEGFKPTGQSRLKKKPHLTGAG